MPRTILERLCRWVTHGVLLILVGIAAAKYLEWTTLLTGPSLLQAGYVLLAALLLGWFLQVLRTVVATDSGLTGGWMENGRLVTLLGLAIWLFRPFLSPDFFGGQDARSYGYGMMDVLQQARAGVFPVFVGQGEFMFNGAIHPIRTAPYHQYLGILLDLLTARALSPLAVQHLAVVVTAIQAGLTCYVCLVLLAPTRRGLAWIMAVFYITTPAMAHYIYPAEMYMSFMAFAYLPVVLFGTVRIIQRDDAAGWIGLAVGLAMLWICHPPVAAWVTLCVLGIQGLRLLTRDMVLASWRRAGGGLVLFGGLTTYYFWSIAEISAMSPEGVAGTPFAVVGFVIGIAAMVRYLATGRWLWLGTMIAAAGGLWLTEKTYGRWLGGAVVPSVLFTAASSYWPGWRGRERLPEWAVAILLAGGLLTVGWTLPADQTPSYRWVEQLFPTILYPVSPSAALLSDMQIGYAMWGAMVLGVTAIILTRALETRLLAIAGLLWLALLIPVPGVTRLLLSGIPEPLRAISSDILWIRQLPAMIGLATGLGFLGSLAWSIRYPRSGLVQAGLAGLALCWSLRESEKFVRCGYRSFTTSVATQSFYRPDNIRQFAYIFSGLPISPYLTNGVVDYHLESRLLQAEDPTQEAGELVSWENAQHLTLTTIRDENSPLWLHLNPTFTLAPGERILIRFAFFDKNYTGTLILQGPRGFYREYQMPSAGFFPKSFGVARERPKMLAVWNDSGEPQPFELLFVNAAQHATWAFFDDFARIDLQTYDPVLLPVRTLSLIPFYRALVKTAHPVYLETPRMFIPGYRATVNGQPAEVVVSPNSQAMVKLQPGDSTVELRYVGTPVLLTTLVVTALAWSGVLVVALRAWWRGRQTKLPVMP